MMATTNREIKMSAKFAGKCLACKGKIAAGDSILYTPGVGAKHGTCRANEIFDDRPAAIKPTALRPTKDTPGATPTGKAVNAMLERQRRSSQVADTAAWIHADSRPDNGADAMQRKYGNRIDDDDE